MKYCVLLKIDAPKGGAGLRAEAHTWLKSHVEKMISDQIGCFKSVKFKDLTVRPAEFLGEDLCIIYKLRDPGAFDRYEREFAQEMRADPTRPECIKVVARWTE